jgi:hypothetical protein
MFIKLLLFSVAIVAVVMLAFGIRMLFDKKAHFTAGTCSSSVGADGKPTCGCQPVEKDNCHN